MFMYYICIHIFAHLHIYTCIYIHTHIYVCLYDICIHVYMYIYLYIYIFSSYLLQHCKIYYFVSQCMFSHVLHGLVFNFFRSIFFCDL